MGQLWFYRVSVIVKVMTTVYPINGSSVSVKCEERSVNSIQDLNQVNAE